MSDDSLKARIPKAELGAIPEGEPAAKPVQLPAPRPRKPRYRHPSELDAESRAKRVTIEEAKSKRLSRTLAQLEKIVVPQLAGELEPARDPEGILLRAEAIYRASMLKGNYAAANTAVLMQANVIGAIVQRSAVMTGSPNDFINSAQSREEIARGLSQRTGDRRLERAYLDMVKRLDSGDYDVEDDDAANE
jgi:hypothetical protein